MKPATERLEVIARRMEENNKTSVYQVMIYDEGRTVVIFKGVGYKLRRRNGT